MSGFNPYSQEQPEDEDPSRNDQSKNKFDNMEINSNMFPPDDTLNTFELWDNAKNVQNSPGYGHKGKSQSRYDDSRDSQDEKLTINNGDQDILNYKNMASNANENDYGLNFKDRQIYDGRISPNLDYTENYVPDVSNLDEQDLMASQVSVDRNIYQEEHPSSFENESSEMLEFHDHFFQNLKNMGIDPSNIQGIDVIKEQLRNAMLEGSRNNDPNAMLSKVRELLHKVSLGFGTNNPQPAQNQHFHDEQNTHPNVGFQDSMEESKLDNSRMQDSAFSNQGKYQARTPENESYPPEEQPQRKYQEANFEITPGERAQKYDESEMPNFHPSQHIDGDDPDTKLRLEEESLPLSKRLPHTKWQIRKNAYIELATMFQRAAQGERFFMQDHDREVEYNPLLKYEEWLIRMIKDLNLSTQLQGLNTILVYLYCSEDIKATVLSTLPELLDKINHKKQNFREITIQIIELMFDKGMGSHICTELLKRFVDAKNDDIAEFSIQILELIIRKDNSLGVVGHLEHIFNGILHTLLHKKDKIRNAGIKLLKQVYVRISDDVESIMKRLKKLRPVLKKEIKETLQNLTKLEGHQTFRIFPKTSTAEPEEPTPKKISKVVEDLKVDDISNDYGTKKPIDDSKADLCTLISEKFDRLAYIQQVVEKKNILTDFYTKLRNLHRSRKKISKGENYKIYNIISLML